MEALIVSAAQAIESAAMPRFVILEHDHPSLHWDLMLEAGAVLRTWRLAASPAQGVPIVAVAAFDHRPVYLDYEGPISGNRGKVVRWDWGEFDWQVDSDQRVVVRLRGVRLVGELRLVRRADSLWSASLLTEPAQ